MAPGLGLKKSAPPGAEDKRKSPLRIIKRTSDPHSDFAFGPALKDYLWARINNRSHVLPEGGVYLLIRGGDYV